MQSWLKITWITSLHSNNWELGTQVEYSHKNVSMLLQDRHCWFDKVSILRVRHIYHKSCNYEKINNLQANLFMLSMDPGYRQLPTVLQLHHQTCRGHSFPCQLSKSITVTTFSMPSKLRCHCRTSATTGRCWRGLGSNPAGSDFSGVPWCI